MDTDTDLTPAEGLAPDGKPYVGPFDRAEWRAWLSANHATFHGVYLASWRRGSGRTSVPYEEAVEEALCVGWVDATLRQLDDDRSIQWFAPRRPRSGWARSNKERVARLTAQGLMLPAGIAAVEEAKRRGTWTMLDDVENLVIPPDLAAALAARPPAREHWDAFSKSARRGILEWIRQARRPETRATRIEVTATSAASNEKPSQLFPGSGARQATDVQVDDPLTAMTVVAVALLGGMVVAWVLWTLVAGVSTAARREVNRARGAERPDWAPGIWICAACKSSNAPRADRCASCRRPREELAHAPVEPRPDWIPEQIAVEPGRIVTLVHDPAAHADPGAAHWRLTAGGQTVGSAAGRDGALALLRALDGPEAVALDVRGTGPATYRLGDLIVRFEAPRFPLDVPCPERDA